MLRLNEEEVLLTDEELLIEDIVDRLMDQGMSVGSAIILLRGARLDEDDRSPAPSLEKVLTPEFVLYLCE